MAATIEGFAALSPGQSVVCLMAVPSCGDGNCLMEALGYIFGADGVFGLRPRLAELVVTEEAYYLEEDEAARAGSFDETWNVPAALAEVSVLFEVQVLVHSVVDELRQALVVNMSHPSALASSGSIHLLCDANLKYHALMEVPLQSALGLPQLWPQPIPVVSDGPLPLQVVAGSDMRSDAAALRLEVASFVDSFLGITAETSYIDRLELLGTQAWLRYACRHWAFPCPVWAVLVYHCQPEPDLEVAAFAYAVLGGSQRTWTRAGLVLWQRRLRKFYRGKPLPCALWRDLVYRADLRKAEHKFKIHLKLSDFMY